jgi:hypothetical protein
MATGATETKYGNQEVYEALLAAQEAFPPILKDSTNPHFSSRFASLAGIKKIVDPVLRANNLLLIQPVKGEALHTSLIHVPSGASIESVYPIPPQDQPQKTGSALSYARRYALCAILGIVADDDDDGNAASGSIPATNTPAQGGGLKDRVANARQNTGGAPPTVRNPDEAPSDKQISMIKGKSTGFGWDSERLIREIKTVTGREVVTTADLTKGEASQVIDALIKRSETGVADEPLNDWDEEPF